MQGVRYHGIFDDDMGVVLGPRNYSFAKIKKSWDFQIGLGLHPIVELSFMPAVLAGCSWADPGPSSRISMSRPLQQALLTPKGTPGSLYRCGGST